ncbi:HNH endonuclease [Pseudomonas syringae]|uniref:HNH endonuclease n=1 Tax=Pseudomonas syringae TaxID=317 RepID=UPI001CA8E607|nr:HNH endonuclease [Pseudomonas syringae]MCI3946908.1 HNH endonuclease [Pseudomonas syringae]
MRQFERDDEVRATAGDVDAQLRVERRKDVMMWNSNKRRSALKTATPDWADYAAIEAFYVEARRLSVAMGVKHEVDHIIPLQGKNVCGLHVSWNLRVITKTANMSKHAAFGDDGVVDFLAKQGLEILFGVRKLKRAIRLGKSETVLLVSPQGQRVLVVAYVQGEFSINVAPEMGTRPSVAVAEARGRPPNVKM